MGNFGYADHDAKRNIDVNSQVNVVVEKSNTRTVVSFGDTNVRVVFGPEEYEFLFTPENPSQRIEGPESVTKLCVGLLGLYKWANQNHEFMTVLQEGESVVGTTTSAFLNGIARIFKIGGHQRLVNSYPDGGENPNIQINLGGFVGLSADDELIRYFRRIRERAGWVR